MDKHERPVEPAGVSATPPDIPQAVSPQPRAFNGVEDIVMAVLLAALSVIMMISVMSRYLLPRVPISYVDQLLPDIFVWLSILGAAAAARRGSHLGMTALTDRLPSRGRHLAAVVAALVGTVFFVALAYSGAEIVAQQLRLGSRAAFGYPAWVIAVAIPVGSVVAIVRIVQHTWSVVRADREGQAG